MKLSGIEEDYTDKINLLNQRIEELEKHLAQNEIQFGNSQYINECKAVLDNIGVGFAFISPNMEILDMNKQMKDWFPNVDVSNKPICYKVFNNPPRDDICKYCLTYKTLRDGKVHESITDTLMGDKIIHYRVVSSPIKDEKGKVVAAIEMVEDITENKRIEEDLERSSAILNSIFEGPENIIAFSLDGNYRYIFFNQAHRQTMKNIWDVDIEIGKNMLDYISYPGDREKAKINFDRALSGENLIEIEEYGEEALSRRYWEDIYNPIQSGDEIIGLTVFSIDITERQKAAEKLRQSEEKFRAVTESAIDAIITTDSKGIISFFNNSLLELFGYSASELSGKPVSILIPLEHKNGHLKGMELLKSGEMHRTGKTSRAIGLKKDGTDFPCEMSLSAWKSGKDTYFTSIIRDLTEQKKAEDALVQAKEEWEHTFDAVPDLIAIIDTNFRIIRVNKAMADRLGISTEEAVGVPCYNAVHGLNGPPPFCPNLELLKDIREHTGEVHEDNIGGDFIVSVSPLNDSKGKLMGSVHVARDITERKRAEEALRESEEKFRLIFNNANDMISLNLMNEDDMPGRFLEVNDVASERLGYSRSEMLNMSPPDIVAPEKRSEMLGNAQVLIENGHNTFEILHMTKDGKRIPVEVNNHLIKYKGQDVCLAISRDITERKRAEEALKKSEEKYRTIFENVQDIFFQTDIKGNIIEISPSVEKYFGISRKKLIGNNVDMLYFNPTDRKELLKVLQEKGEVNDYEITLKDNINNQFIYISANAHLIFDSRNRPVGIEGALRDITERKKAEKELKMAQIHLENAIDLANLVTWEFDVSNMMFIFNDRFYSMYGTTAESEGGYKMSAWNYIKNFVHPEDKSPIEEGFRLVDETHAPAFPKEIEHRIVRRDGETRWVLVHLKDIWDDEGNYVGGYGANQDITERKEAEESLKLNQIQLSNAMDLAHLANWELDPFKEIYIFNDKFYSMLGTTAENEGGYEMPIDYYIKEYVHPDDAQFIEEGMKKSLEVREPTFGTELEHRIIRRDGDIRYVAIRIRFIPATESQKVRVYGTVQDITRRKIAEQNLKESLKEKEVLIKEIHHRVKNNLMVISSLLDLQSQYVKDKEDLNIFRESQNRARSMALIHERLYQSTDLKRIDFGDYIRTLAIDLFHTYVTDPSRVKLNINVENVMVDINTTVPLGLIVNELVTNSMKHAFPGGEKGEINIDFGLIGDEYVLKVYDDGVGFPKNIDFRNTESLGLQLVNSLVGQIDGSIELNRTHGTGFTIKFKEMEL